MTERELERFLARVESDSHGCWVWTGVLVPQGYGRLQLESGRIAYAHRASYAHFRGKLRAGDRVEHVSACASKACVNPDHLEVRRARAE